MTFIVLEGVDGAGKSTLADAIVQELQERFPEDSVGVFHSSQLQRDPFDEYALAHESYRPNSGMHVVCDRLHWGEMIYGPLYRGESKLSTAGFRWVELYLRARGATVWHVTAPLRTIQKRLVTRGEDYLETHHVEHVWDQFGHVAKHSMLTGGTIDTYKFKPDEAAMLIVNEAMYQEEQAAYHFRPEYVGRSMPAALLVGDKQGTGDPGVTLAPFMPRGTSSGKFLLEALPEEFWDKVGLVNANETKLHDVWDALFNPPVIALGLNASEALDDAGIDHGVVPHPQKIRRFHNRLKDSYGYLIREVSITGGNRLSWPSS